MGQLVYLPSDSIVLHLFHLTWNDTATQFGSKAIIGSKKLKFTRQGSQTVTLPAKKYRSLKTRFDRGWNYRGELILFAKFGLDDIVIYNKFTRMPVDYTIKNLWPVLLILFSILGVLIFLFYKLGGKVPD
jgi:hypothetical protein